MQDDVVSALTRTGHRIALWTGVNKEVFALVSELKVVYVGIDEISPNPKNSRRRPPYQVDRIAQSMTSFEFNAPILVDAKGTILAGHGRLEAAKLAGLTKVPAIYLNHLNEDQATAFMLADNKLAEMSKWDEPQLAEVIKELAAKTLEFELEDIGFAPSEIDRLTRVLQEPNFNDTIDDFEASKGPAVSNLGDGWRLGPHISVFADALSGGAYRFLIPGDFAAMTFTDLPWNLPVKGFISGRGKIQHREFAQGSGEMSPEQFQRFVDDAFKHFTFLNANGSLLYICTDWRNYEVMLSAARACGLNLINVCVWVKNNGGMGSLYRSQHEMVMVFHKGDEPHRNNVQLGRNGRNRTNVWNYPAATVPVKGKRPLEFHPTPKPVLMVAEAILDCTKAGDLVMDPFSGSGTLLLAAEHTGRRAYCCELDPRYVDTGIRRWEKMTGGQATHIASGRTFAEITTERLADGK